MDRQDAYERKLRQIIERDCDGSRLNDTKWMELLEVLRDLRLRYRVKFLDRNEPSVWRYGIQGGRNSYLPTPYIEGPSSPVKALAIEWVEIDASDLSGIHVEDLAAEVERRLMAVGVSYTATSSLITVIGHIRRPPPQ